MPSFLRASGITIVKRGCPTSACVLRGGEYCEANVWSETVILDGKAHYLYYTSLCYTGYRRCPVFRSRHVFQKANVTRILVKCFVHGLVLMLLSGGAALAVPQGYELLFANALYAAALSDADRQAIYGQLGLKAGPDGKTLVFTDDGCPPLQPGSGDVQINTEDLNGDQHPEVFASLGSVCMFGSAGTGIYLLTRDGAGHWKSHNLGAGV